MFLGCSKTRTKNHLQYFTNMLGVYSNSQLVSTVSLLIFYTTFSFVFSKNIEQGPLRVTAVEGESVYLNCYTNHLNPEYSIKWLQGQHFISNGELVNDKFEDRFKITVSPTSQGQGITLSIDNVQRKDGTYLYYCGIYQNEKEIEKSDPAGITIKEIPSSRYPECTPIIGQMTNGVPSTLICRSEQTNPLPKLRLIRNGNEDENIKYNTKNESNYIMIEHSFTPSINDETEKTMFMCILETPAKIEYTSNCSFGPFNVMHKPQMTIKGEAVVTEGKEVIFICQGKGNPSQITYMWKFTPKLPEGTYKLESFNSILRLTPTSHMTATKLECEGSNLIGKSSAFLTLNITFDQAQRPHLSGIGSRPSIGKDPQNSTMATILSVAGTCLLVISVLAATTICYIYLCFRKNFHPLGYKIAQPDVYSEPRDSLPPPVLSTTRVARWQKRNVGIQVSLDYNISEEPLYSETPTAKTPPTEVETTTTEEETPPNRSATYV